MHLSWDNISKYVIESSSLSNPRRFNISQYILSILVKRIGVSCKPFKHVIPLDVMVNNNMPYYEIRKEVGFCNVEYTLT